MSDFESVGQILPRVLDRIEKKQYEFMELSELKEKQKIAEDWLKTHEEHPKFEEALERYELLCNVMRIKESGLLTPKE